MRNLDGETPTTRTSFEDHLEIEAKRLDQKRKKMKCENEFLLKGE